MTSAATVVFCRRFYAQDRRMTDQMVQAARSGVRNIMLCAVNQAAYLLKRQLESQGETFVESGGFTEKLYGARSQARKSDRSEQPRCPKCGQSMTGTGGLTPAPADGAMRPGRSSKRQPSSSRKLQGPSPQAEPVGRLWPGRALGLWVWSFSGAWRLALGA